MAKSALDGLEQGARRLIDDNRRLRGEVARLREAQARQREENKKLGERAAELDKRLTVKELAATFGADPTRLDRLIREVDECIKAVNG